MPVQPRKDFGRDVVVRQLVAGLEDAERFVFAPQQLEQRTLAYDDIAGISEIYPKASTTAGLGRIQGTIRSGSAGVFGANVVAINADGTPMVAIPNYVRMNREPGPPPPPPSFDRRIASARPKSIVWMRDA